MRRICSTCEVEKEISEFPRDKSGKDGYRAQCRVCNAARRREHYYKNRERELERSRKYREDNLAELVAKRSKTYEDNRDIEINRSIEWKRNNPEKVRAHKYNRRNRELACLCDWDAGKESSVLSYFSGCCALTGDTSNLTMDHFIPLVTGKGGTRIGNMIPMRADLNFSKNDSNPFEWFERHYTRLGLSRSRFDAMVQYLANLNGMTIGDYKTYVNDCFNVKTTQNSKEAA